MSTKDTKCKKVKEAVLHSPLLIPHYLRDTSYNNQIVYSVLKHLIPFRVGVELECGGDVRDSLSDTWERNPYASINQECLLIKEKYKLIDFGQDNNYSGMREHKISFNYKSIKGFYQILEDMKIHCIENTKGACHIHIENKYKNDMFNSAIFRAQHEIIKKLSVFVPEIAEIFGGYTGTYNGRGVSFGKGDWLSIRNNPSTYEFRIGRCNFDYETLIEWVIKCSSVVKKCNNIVKTTLKLKY